MEVLKACNYLISFHEHEVSFIWSKSHLYYATDAFSLKSTGIPCLMVPSVISGGMRCVLTLRRCLAGSPPCWEKFCYGGTGLLQDSPKNFWEGTLTCSLLTSLWFQEGVKQGEGLRLGTVLTASASDQHQGKVRIHTAGWPYCLNYHCVILRGHFSEATVDHRGAACYQSMDLSSIPYTCKIILLHLAKRIYWQGLMKTCSLCIPSYWWWFWVHEIHSSRCSFCNQHAVGNNETEKFLLIPHSNPRTVSCTQEEKCAVSFVCADFNHICILQNYYKLLSLDYHKSVLHERIFLWQWTHISSKILCI